MFSCFYSTSLLTDMLVVTRDLHKLNNINLNYIVFKGGFKNQYDLKLNRNVFRCLIKAFITLKADWYPWRKLGFFSLSQPFC